MFILPANFSCPEGINKKNRENRNRDLSLIDKKHIVELYFQFVDQIKTTHQQEEVSNKILKYKKTLFSDTGELEDETNFKNKSSVRAFVEFYNKRFVPFDNLLQRNNTTLVSFRLFRWLRAYYRGDYLVWEGQNDLSKSNCRSKLILRTINRNLKTKYAIYCRWNAVVKSPSALESYGVIAKRDILADTILCFVESVYVENNNVDCIQTKFQRMNTVPITGNSHLDMSDFTSCYARYYNRVTSNTVANVYMTYMHNWTNPNRAICCVSSVAIHKGDEFIVEKVIHCNL